MTEKEIAYLNRNKSRGTSNSSFGLGVALAFVLLAFGFVGYRIVQHFITKHQEDVARRENAEQQQRLAAQQQQEQERAAEEQKKHRPIVIKGLYIGMDAQDVPAAIAQKFGPQWKLNKGTTEVWTVTTDGLEKWLNAQAKYNLSNPVGYEFDWRVILTFWSGKLHQFKIGHNCSLELFGNPNLSEDDFVHLIMDSYNIPKMDGGAGCWNYISPDNVNVKVTTAREVEVWQGADREAAKKHFN